jgi:hypothetical protein
MFDIKQFRELIIKSTLNDLNMYSPEAEELLVFTCAVESNGGTYLHQLFGGPGLGIFQMEPETYIDIWANYINKHNNLITILATNFDVCRIPSPERLIYDLRFATAMTRIFYARFKEPLPKIDDVDNIWWYYKKFYNTDLGGGWKEHALMLYQGFRGSDHDN